MTICRHCQTTWTGTGIAHCAACHRTFTTASNFDRHRAGSKSDERVGGQCNDPTLAGLQLNAFQRWAMPPREEPSP